MILIMSLKSSQFSLSSTNATRVYINPKIDKVTHILNRLKKNFNSYIGKLYFIIDVKCVFLFFKKYSPRLADGIKVLDFQQSS